jgi:proton-dependent oligopeptide transporter, POT family
VVLFTSAIATIGDMAFVPLCRNPLFVYLYITVGIIAFVAACLFWILYRKYNKEEDKMNALDKTSTNLPKLISEMKQDAKLHDMEGDA